MKNEKYNILERTKVSRSMSRKIDKYCLKHGCSRSQLLRDALEHFLEYEESLVQQELTEIRAQLTEVHDCLQVLIDLQKQK